MTDSYPVAFKRRKRGEAEDLGKEMRGAQRVMGRTNSVFPTILCVPLKATGYESVSMVEQYTLPNTSAHEYSGPINQQYPDLPSITHLV